MSAFQAEVSYIKAKAAGSGEKPELLGFVGCFSDVKKPEGFTFLSKSRSNLSCFPGLNRVKQFGSRR